MVQSLSRAVAAYRVIAQSEGKSPRTVEWIEASAQSLQRFLGSDVALEAITVEDVRRWILAMRQRPKWAGLPQERGSLSSTSINNYVRGLKLLFSTLAREGLSPPHPVAQMKPPKAAQVVIKPYTEPQLRAIFKALGETAHSLRDRAVVALMFDPGMRLSEAVGLQVAQVDLVSRSLVVRGKGNKERQLPLGGWTSKQLLAYTTRERPNSNQPHLFLEDDGRPLTGHALQGMLRRVSQKVGFRVSAHKFRHTAAITYLRNGGDSLYLQAILGHSSLVMTRRYAAIAGADLQQAHLKYSPGDRLRL